MHVMLPTLPTALPINADLHYLGYLGTRSVMPAGNLQPPCSPTTVEPNIWLQEQGLLTYIDTTHPT